MYAPQQQKRGTTSTTTNDAIEYLHRDHLGSVEAVTDEDGDSLLVLAWDPFGERRKTDWTRMLNASERVTLAAELNLTTSRGYTGHEHLDRTGFIHMNGRVYDPQLGRFLSPDPIIADPGSSQSWNLYSYVSNSPLSYVDPSGLVTAGSLCNVGYIMCQNNAGGGGGGSSQRSATINSTFQFLITAFYVSWTPNFTNRGWGLRWGDTIWTPRFHIFNFPVSVNVTRDVQLPDTAGIADKPMEIPRALAGMGASVLIPGYDLVQCNLSNSCTGWDWVLGVGEVAITATGVGYLGRVAVKSAITAVRSAKAAKAKSAANRASEIHKAAPEATQRRTTISVTETSEGIRIISSSEKRLRPAQRKLLQQGDVEGIGLGHAEVTGVNAARQLGLNPTGTATSRPICQGCQKFLKEQGVIPLSPLKK